MASYANPFTDRAGRRHKNNGQFAAKRKSATKRKRPAAGKRRKRAAYANPFTDRAGRVHRNNGKFASKRGAAAHKGGRRRGSSLANRPRDKFGRLLPMGGGARSNPYTDRAGHRHRDNGKFMSKRRGSAAGRKRNKRGQYENPFDGHGYFHDDATGRFAGLPSRRHAKKRSAFARGVSESRKRRKNGTFKNPAAGRRAVKNRPRDSKGHFLPVGGRRNPWDMDGRYHSRKKSRKRR